MFVLQLHCGQMTQDGGLRRGREERLDVDLYGNITESEHWTFYIGGFKHFDSHNPDHVV